MSASPSPCLTVVIAASQSAEAVARAVASLGPIGHEIEIIVSAPRETVLPPPFPPTDLVWIAAATRDVPVLRRLGLDRARGAIVAFTEDSCLLSPGWDDAWLRAFADARVEAATGPVVPVMGNRSLDWAVFFCEYAPFLPGPFSGRIAGNNFAIRRDLARTLDPRAIHESDVSQTPDLVPRAGAGHARRYSAVEAIGDRLRFGFEYGRRRASALRHPARLGGFLVGPAILLAQSARLVLTLSRRPAYVPRFLETLPLTLGLLTAWSVGEWIGWMSATVRPLGQTVSRRRYERAAPRRGQSGAPARSPRPRCTREQPAA